MAAGYDVSGGFATYGSAASSLTSIVDKDITEIKDDVDMVSAQVSSFSESWKNAVDDEISGLSRGVSAANGSIDLMKSALVIPKPLVPDLIELSSWLVVVPNTMKVRQQFSTGVYGNYTTYKYIVDGGRTYTVKTAFGGQNTGLGLFLYNESLSVGYDNTVSCLAYNPSGAGIFDIEFKAPTAEQKYVLGTFNNSSTMLSSNMVVADKYPVECPYNLTRVGKDIYTPSEIEPVEIVKGSWYSASNDLAVSQSYATVVSSSPYSALKYIVEGGK